MDDASGFDGKMRGTHHARPVRVVGRGRALEQGRLQQAAQGERAEAESGAVEERAAVQVQVVMVGLHNFKKHQAPTFKHTNKFQAARSKIQINTKIQNSIRRVDPMR
jgi:hypothetical protein